MIPESTLIARLTALRRSVRRRLIGYGLCAVLAGGVVSFLTVVALDWLLELPWGLRMAGAGLFFVGFAGATWHWIIKPLRAPITLDDIAGQLERRFADIEDQLSSAVSFTQRGDIGSSGMVDEVIARAEQTVRALPLASALSLRPLIVRFVWLIVASVVLAGVVVAVPKWVQTGLVRYVDPLGDVTWPRTVSIKPLTGDMVAAVGESVEVRMSIVRGLTDSLRAVVHVYEPNQTPTALAMVRNEGGDFSATIDALTRNIDYWFQAGDDSTRRHPFRIRVVQRPAVMEAIATAHPPDYARDRPPRVQDLRDGPMSAVIGSTVDIHIRAGKPVQGSHEGKPVGLRFTDRPFLPLATASTNRQQLNASFTVEQDVAFRVELYDDDGFSNRGATTYLVNAVSDKPPVVSMIEPRATTEVTPIGVVPVAARIVDDYGISRVQLRATRLSGEPLITLDVKTKERKQSTDRVELQADYVWSLEPLNLSPGDALAFDIVAADNRRIGDALAEQVGASSLMRLKIISKAEFEARLRGEMAIVEAKLRGIVSEQSVLLDRTSTLEESIVDENELLSLSNRMAATRASGQQTRLIRPLRDVARYLVQWAERMRQNGVGTEETRARLRDMGESLRATAVGPVSKAGASLQRVGEGLAASHEQEALSQTADAQRRALDEMSRLLKSIALWGGFQGLVTRARELLERQELLRAQTGRLGKSMLGRSAESLSPEEIASLRRVATEQKQVARDYDTLLQRMQRERDTVGKEDSASAVSIDEAMRAARANELASRLQAAAGAIEQNRTAGAMVEQKAASQAMRKVIAALRSRQDRALAELRKHLDDARELVAELIEDETAVRKATHEAGRLRAAPDVFASLETEQRRIRTNTDAVGDDLSVNERTAVVTPVLRRAGEAMREAEQQVRIASADLGEAAQDRAIARLQDAYEQLDKQAREAEREAFRRTLAEVRESLEAIRDAQKEVDQGIGEIKGDVDRKGRLGRAQVRQAVRLARAQGDVRTLVDELMPELQRVVVYRWALERVVTWMERVRRALYERRVDDDVVRMSGRIVSELEKLINALIETEALPVDTDFVEQASSDGAGGKSGSAVTVPTVAELLVLKTMQEDVNNRTRTLANTMDADRPSETQLRRLQSVGEDQAQVRRLTDRVTRRARP